VVTSENLLTIGMMCGKGKVGKFARDNWLYLFCFYQFEI